MEEWRDVPEYEGIYQVSNYGRLKSLCRTDAAGKTRKEKYLKPHETVDGYYSTTLIKNGKRKVIGIHRVVYLAFKGDIPEGMEINHINENKKDNTPGNLEVLTKADNIKYGTARIRAAQSMMGRLINRPDHSKWVIQLSLNNEILHFYPSTMQAERETGIKHTAIGACCRNKVCKDRNGNIYNTKTAGGYIWKYTK